MATGTRGQRHREPAQHSNEFAYNSAKHTDERRKAPITVWESDNGSGIFHRRLKDNAVTRDAARLQREQQIANRRAAALEAQMADLAIEQVDEWAALAEQITPIEQEAIEKSYELVSMLLENDDGASPTVDELKTKSDIEEIGKLVRVLLGGGEPVTPPTTTPTTSSS